MKKRTCPILPGIFNSNPPLDTAAAVLPYISNATAPTVSSLKKQWTISKLLAYIFKDQPFIFYYPFSCLITDKMLHQFAVVFFPWFFCTLYLNENKQTTLVRTKERKQTGPVLCTITNSSYSTHRFLILPIYKLQHRELYTNFLLQHHPEN